MYKKSKSGHKFKVMWEKKRKNKFKFIVLMGLLHGIVMGSMLYWLFKFAYKDSFSILTYGYWFIGMSISGIGTGFLQFKGNEKNYQQILKWESEEKANKII